MHSPIASEIQAAVATLAAAHGHRDPFTCRHEARAAGVAVELGHLLGLASRRIEVLRLAALVHDIGKIGVPTEIVGKAGRLSPQEYALMQTHCDIGYDILNKLGSPDPIAEIAYQHHERLDGSGYPRGLAGDAILVEARILAVADVFDAMSSHRSYRPALPLEDVLAELRTQAGRMLDARVVDACTTLARQRRSEQPEDTSSATVRATSQASARA